MVLYVVTDTYEQYRKNPNWFHTRDTLEEAAGDACIVLHYKQVNLATVSQARPWAICHSGGGTDYKDYDVLQDSAYRRVVREFAVAQIGFCGGHQIIARFFGSRLGPMRKLRPGEPDLASYSPGYFKEWGVYPVDIVKGDPLFRGFRKRIMVQEYHYWEVKRLGPALVLLASSADCRVQAFRHRTRPVYGTQFHPERHSDAYPDGARILENFFRIARNARQDLAGRPLTGSGPVRRTHGRSSSGSSSRGR
jgi:GMP synthase-like glutamine amidotransferase